MIKWILILLIVAAAASLLGMPALAGAAATGARILIGIVLILFLLLILGVWRHDVRGGAAEVEVQPFAQLPAGVRAAAEAEAAALAAHLGRPLRLRWT